ncbi:MAG: hypothetical protein KC591_16580 [Gemmatimonadetes bacterium]|nr:hypothetical protein [Gemmatimonadota bacterium]
MSPNHFRGFPPTTRSFLTRHGETPEHAWDGSTRAEYATVMLAPLKALCRDLAERLPAIGPRIVAEPRVGASLWGAEGIGAPACRIRFWDADLGRERSPWIFVNVTSEGIEIGAVDQDPRGSGAGRLRSALLPHRPLRAHVAGLAASGWRISGTPLPDAGDGAVPDDLRAWMIGSQLRVSLLLDWADWTGEPGLVDEIADRLREIVPVFDAMRGADLRVGSTTA